MADSPAFRVREGVPSQVRFEKLLLGSSVPREQLEVPHAPGFIRCVLVQPRHYLDCGALGGMRHLHLNVGDALSPFESALPANVIGEPVVIDFPPPSSKRLVVQNAVELLGPNHFAIDQDSCFFSVPGIDCPELHPQ